MTDIEVDSGDAQDSDSEMARQRGYVLDCHRVMAANDLPVLKAANEFVSAAYKRERSLDRRTKE